MSIRTLCSRNHPNRRRRALTVLGAAVVAVAVCAPGAQASGDRTGVYSGKAIHEAFSFAPDAEPWTTSFVLRVNDRRVTGIHVEARLECPEVSIMDLRFSRLVLREKPALSPTDSFVLRKNGITVRGHVGRLKATGTISAAKDGCRAPGVDWAARKRRTL